MLLRSAFSITRNIHSSKAIVVSPNFVKQNPGRFVQSKHSTMSSYTSQYPGVEVDPAIKQYFETFYQTSDTPDAHEKYADSFTKDAKLIMASKTCQGYDGMHKLAISIRQTSGLY